MKSAAPFNGTRLPLFALLFFFTKTLYQIVRNAMNLIPAFAGILVVSETIREYALIAVPSVIGLFVVIGGALHYWYFRYRVSADTIYVRQGILHRTEMALQFSRIQQAEILQPFYFRPLKRATLSVDSAGSSAQEVKLAGLPYAEAQALQQQVLLARDEATEGSESREKRLDDQTETGVTLPPRTYYQLHTRLSEVLKVAFTDTRALLYLPAVVAVLFQFNRFTDGIGTQIENLAAQVTAEVLTLLWIALGVLLAVLVVIGALAYAVVRFYNFQLHINDERTQTKAGLFSIKTLSIRHEKRQRVQIKQNYAALMFERYSLNLKQVQPNNHGRQATNMVTIPVLTRPQKQELAIIFGLSIPRWQPVKAGWMLGPVLLHSLIGSVLIAVFVNVLLYKFVAAAGWALLMLLINWRRWRQRGLYWDGEWFAYRSGFIGAQENWYPIYKAQKVTLSEPPLQRWFGLATVTVYTAGGSERVPWISKTQAQKLQQEVLWRTTSHQGSWM